MSNKEEIKKAEEFIRNTEYLNKKTISQFKRHQWVTVLVDYSYQQTASLRERNEVLVKALGDSYTKEVGDSLKQEVEVKDIACKMLGDKVKELEQELQERDKALEAHAKNRKGLIDKLAKLELELSRDKEALRESNNVMSSLYSSLDNSEHGNIYSQIQTNKQLLKDE